MAAVNYLDKKLSPWRGSTQDEGYPMYSRTFSKVRGEKVEYLLRFFPAEVGAQSLIPRFMLHL